MKATTEINSKYTSMKSVFDLVGNTPLIEIKHKKAHKVIVAAKLEYYNPSGSVKDRAACQMLVHALEHDQLNGKILIEATSGNTGIAFAMMGAELGVPVEIALPENASPERKLLLENYGAKLHFTSAQESTDGTQDFVKELVDKQPDNYYYPDQYNNENNWKAHVETTGPEIWEQSDTKVTHFVAGMGTTGTFTGTSRFLQPKGVICISVQPSSPMHGLEGWKHLQTALVPGIYDDSLADETLIVDTEDAYSYAVASSKYLGLQISPSSAANLVAALRVAEKIEEGYIVTVFPDNAFKYLQEPFWKNNAYHIENPFA